MDCDQEGRLGYWDEVSPSYTIFNNENQTFSSIWTAYNLNFSIFYDNCFQDIKTYSNSKVMTPKPNAPQNTFNISSIPWIEFTSFNLNVHNEGYYLPPIFTIGKLIQNDERTLMPLAIQVHHAVCDGFHPGVFIATLQELADHCLNWIK